MIAQGKEKKKDYKEGCNMEQAVADAGLEARGAETIEILICVKI